MASVRARSSVGLSQTSAPTVPLLIYGFKEQSVSAYNDRTPVDLASTSMAARRIAYIKDRMSKLGECLQFKIENRREER